MRNQRNPKTDSKIKKHAAAIIAAAVAALWILIELALFAMSTPGAPEMIGADLCIPNGKSEHSVEKATPLYFSERCGEIHSISFLAEANDPQKYNDKPVSVKVKAFTSKDSNSVVTYTSQNICVGKNDAERSTFYVDIPEDAGQVIVEFSHEGFDYTVSDVKFNAKGSGRFNYLRTAIVLAVVVICWLCHRFKLWQVFFDPSKKSHRRMGAALCILCVIIALLLSSLLNENKSSVEYPLASDPVYYDPYEQQFDALMKGQLHLDIEPSKELLELENPYDPAQREGVAYSWDRAFYNGKYYSYFGMAPIFTVYYPYYLITGDMPAEDTVTTVFAVMTALFFSLAAVKWASIYTKKLPIPMLFIGVIGALFSTQIFLMMRGRAKFYYIATVAGMAFLSLFLWLLLCGISAEGEKKEKWKRLVFYFLAGIAFGLTFLSRVNIALVAAFVVLPMLWFKVITQKNEEGKTKFRKPGDIAAELLALGIPVIAAVVFQLVINYLRFDSIFEFGSTYQLTVSDISQNRFRLTDLPYAIYHYFIQPISLSSDFPFASLNYAKLNDYGHYVYIDTGMGILSIPMMWMLFGSVLIFANKKRSKTYKFTLGSVLVGMVAVALFDFCFGGVIFRYSCDLTLIGAFAAMAVTFSLCEDSEAYGDGGELRKGSAFALSAICIASLIISLSLAMSLNANLTAYDPRAYIRFRDLFTWF